LTRIVAGVVFGAVVVGGVDGVAPVADVLFLCDEGLEVGPPGVNVCERCSHREIWKVNLIRYTHFSGIQIW
jgi:hypothetical protein